MGRHDAQLLDGRRRRDGRQLAEARPTDNHRRDPPTERRPRRGHRDGGGEKSQIPGDHRSTCAPRCSLGHTAELPGRRRLHARGRRELVLLRFLLPPDPARHHLHRRDGGKPHETHGEVERGHLRHGYREGATGPPGHGFRAFARRHIQDGVDIDADRAGEERAGPFRRQAAPGVRLLEERAREVAEQASHGLVPLGLRHAPRGDAAGRPDAHGEGVPCGRDAGAVLHRHLGLGRELARAGSRDQGHEHLRLRGRRLQGLGHSGRAADFRPRGPARLRQQGRRDAYHRARQAQQLSAAVAASNADRVQVLGEHGEFAQRGDRHGQHHMRKGCCGLDAVYLSLRPLFSDAAEVRDHERRVQLGPDVGAEAPRVRERLGAKVEQRQADPHRQ
mmetsp:Transcript_55929/g.162110  ORF Transcript_55929/g.162110 Transcript_55929/m.162110 type:complete len:390 (-) Transcript_55929:727-1896(-)